jgi:hypothetical protein
MEWEGDSYQARFDALAARGEDVHGEAAFVAAPFTATTGYVVSLHRRPT